ncbi:3'(2'),5'-bisphosphate nucleotidase CysQ [Tardiphaga sp. vice352]|uniref:3'(2'),5'-bisphosphate nucleotidase CysQ n=1 Tax=unclassified Tardiphaga TaxID=2631404 RepID=UPI001162CA57|nr:MULTISPECIES: 3'(2'),5'-bisphosphate nucleotidase CysQ [unclassified Tardiphaga]QDM16004.1 3'(2'),5'-bisphosphate nucleotidase CysQ [Tardiphaga sp. vice278]QDM21103.1 3'(2'),5'-bisphosphate nucleotidase CysQ [Tardiphaga sp. vice154]QDM26200.1 3'(2'),5'-bisphosphate nucleotidase CysQ [Tardiphaga sp. vice304]QDM31347.1 3'(2'),5'-bisphosphate nucleotidase CysQ [Tardiphaga sp. vice352]
MNHRLENDPALDLDDTAALLAPLTGLVARAGAAIRAVNREAMSIDGKADGSPVTEADLAADRVIAEGLARLFPDIPTLSEERLQLACPPYPGRLFLIDPLDGTKEFVAGRREFTVNIALVEGGVPVLGVVGAPDLGLIWRGLVGRGAERLEMSPDFRIRSVTPIRTRAMPRGGAPWIAAVSRSHGDARTEALIDARPGAVRVPLGSALKLCRVAEGAADLYPRLAPTCEWDIAAGQAVVVAAGGIVTDSQGGAVIYGGHRADFIVPEFIAWGDPTAVPRG